MSLTRKNHEGVSSIVKIGAVVMVVCLGLWGCARKPASRVSTADNKVFESKVQKLEQELRTALNARDKARKEVASLEGETARLQQEVAEKAAFAQDKIRLIDRIKSERNDLHKLLVSRTNERDDLRQQNNLRIQERDTLATRMDRMRKGLQQLMSQDDNPASLIPGSQSIPTTPTSGQAPLAGPALGTQS